MEREFDTISLASTQLDDEEERPSTPIEVKDKEGTAAIKKAPATTAAGYITPSGDSRHNNRPSRNYERVHRGNNVQQFNPRPINYRNRGPIPPYFPPGPAPHMNKMMQMGMHMPLMRPPYGADYYSGHPIFSMWEGPWMPHYRERVHHPHSMGHPLPPPPPPPQAQHRIHNNGAPIHLNGMLLGGNHGGMYGNNHGHHHGINGVLPPSMMSPVPNMPSPMVNGGRSSGVRRRARTPASAPTSASSSPRETQITGGGGIKMTRNHEDERSPVAKLKPKFIVDVQQPVETRPAKPFVEATPTADPRCSAPLRSLRTQSGGVTYPLIYVSPAGTISVVLATDVAIELAVDRSIRLICHDKLAAFVNSRGTSSSILHHKARILHTKENVYSKFSSSNDKLAVFGVQGVLFSMSHLPEAFLVSSNIKGASAVALDQLQFSPMDNDYTIKLFYKEAQTGIQFMTLCKEIVHEATYDRKSDGTLIMHINGMTIRQTVSGDVHVDARPRYISCSPTNSTIHLRSAFIDMGVQENEKAFVKRGLKRVHVSRSGMVVSDGNCITSMDHFGRIVSCT